MKRFLAVCVVGGLLIGVCAYGMSVRGSSGDSLPPETMAEAESTTAESAEDMVVEKPEPEVEEVESEKTEGEGYSAGDLENMWSSGILAKEEIEYMVATGEVDYGVYEELLEIMAEDEEFMAQPEGSSTGSVDATGLLTTHVIEFKDPDGYEMRETIKLSPIFTEDDMETMYALWEALGNDISSFPSEDSLYDKSYLLREMRDTGELEYIIGTYAIENLTVGFPITPDSPRNYDGILFTKQVSAFDNEHDGNASTFINVRSVSMVAYSDGIVYYGEKNSTVMSRARMYSNTWGPCAFIIALPNTSTPNLPDGYRYDKTLLLSGGTRFNQDCDAITLEYYTKEVE